MCVLAHEEYRLLVGLFSDEVNAGFMGARKFKRAMKVEKYIDFADMQQWKTDFLRARNS